MAIVLFIGQQIQTLIVYSSRGNQIHNRAKGRIKQMPTRISGQSLAPASHELQYAATPRLVAMRYMFWTEQATAAVSSHSGCSCNQSGGSKGWHGEERGGGGGGGGGGHRL